MNKALFGDCLELMKDIPSGSIDMILCDLPYGTTQCKWDTVIPFCENINGVYFDEFIIDWFKSEKGIYADALSHWAEYSEDGLWENYNRIIKENGAIVLFGSEPFSSALRMSNIKNYKYDWIWNKKKAGNFRAVKSMPLIDYEKISVFNHDKSHYYPQMTKGKMRKKGGYYSPHEQPLNSGTKEKYNDEYYPKGILEYTKANNVDSKLHPTQKPIPLMENLIKTYTNEGETVLDNCAGSFTTSIACLNTDRKYICMEQVQEYFDKGTARIAQWHKNKESEIEIKNNNLELF
jgi:site-specific DNA-methyltransferase (adenine-specific)